MTLLWGNTAYPTSSIFKVASQALFYARLIGYPSLVSGYQSLAHSDWYKEPTHDSF